MLAQLHIKCPSCGVILEVRNPHDEAVKHIVCPQCRKKMSVNFQEQLPKVESQPIEPLYYGLTKIDLHEGVNHIPVPGCEQMEINVVRISDGSCKCIISALSFENAVFLNGMELGKNDKFVLSVGDVIKIAGSEFVYGQQTALPLATPQDESSTKPKKSERDPKGKNKIRPLVIVSAVAVIVAFCLFVLLSKEKSPVTDNDDTTDDTSPEIVETVPKDTINPQEIHPPQPDVIKTTVVNTKPSARQEDEGTYGLEQRSMKGDVSAMYELALSQEKHAIGVNYLKKAAEAGNMEAQELLDQNGW